MLPESAKYLLDMLEAVNGIRAFTNAKKLEHYLTDRQLRDAVQWNFLIIGEALSQLRKFDIETAEQITEWRRIIGFRNQLIHGYGIIKNEITWDIIQTKLPTLHADLEGLLKIA